MSRNPGAEDATWFILAVAAFWACVITVDALVGPGSMLKAPTKQYPQGSWAARRRAFCGEPRLWGEALIPLRPAYCFMTDPARADGAGAQGVQEALHAYV